MTDATQLPARQPTTFYFAYGSNLHLKQMKRRCPNSRYIGTARLPDFRWQINERGYANIIESPGQWVDGLVYEINPLDEARLDVNEGVSKNAYTKLYLKVYLHRAPSTLYRRPTSWIVDQGGPAKVARQAQKEDRKYAEPAHHWIQEVLVYISRNHVEDSSPRQEYVKRINWGLSNARALGIEEDYISNCIRPFIPPPRPTSPLSPRISDTDIEGISDLRGQTRKASSRVAGQPASQKTQAPSPPGNPVVQKAGTKKPEKIAGTKRRASPGSTPPPLPPRPGARHRNRPPIIVVEGSQVSGRSER